MEMIRSKDDSNNHVLTREQFEKISICLSGLAEKLGVNAILLVNSAGQVVTRRISKSWQSDSTLLSSLTANSYAASKEVARLLGESSNFQTVLHEGHYQNVMVSKINADYFLVVIFHTGVAIGMVRLFTRKTIEQLFPVLPQKREGNIQIKQIFDDQFQSLLEDELDRSFKESS